MKINYLLAFIFVAFVSIVIVANVDEINLIGCTELNGYGCVCHTTERDTNVKVWVEGPESLYVGQTGYYKMFMAGGPAEAGGYNVAGRFGEMVLVDSFSFQHPLSLNELTQAFSLPFPTTEDTIYWAFGYTAIGSPSEWDTIYSCGLSLVWDTIPDFHDRWNFGPKFPVKILSLTNANENFVFPEVFVLYQNYPNPFNPSTTIKYDLPKTTNISIKIYDLLGQEIITLADETQRAGQKSVIWNGNNVFGQMVSSGLYICTLQTPEFVKSIKLLLVK
jgi:hypothetical protein